MELAEHLISERTRGLKYYKCLLVFNHKLKIESGCHINKKIAQAKAYETFTSMTRATERKHLTTQVKVYGVDSAGKLWKMVGRWKQ